MRSIPLYPANSFSRRMLRALLSELSAYKQCDLAVEMGVTEARLSQIMSGGNLTLKTIERLLTAAETIRAKDVL